MTDLMGVLEYARHRSVSRVTIHNWTKKGLIEREPDGRIDAERADAQLLSAIGLPIPPRPMAADPASAGPAGDDQPESHAEMMPVALAAVASVQETLAEAGEQIGQSDSDDLGGLNGAGVTLTDARKAKTIQDTHLTRLKVMQLRGDLIDRKTAESRTFDIFRGDRDAWMAWPSRVAPLLAADLRVDQRTVYQLLEQYVHKHLAELSDTIG